MPSENQQPGPAVQAEEMALREQNAFAYGCIAAALRKPISAAQEMGYRERTRNGDAFERGWLFANESHWVRLDAAMQSTEGAPTNAE